MSESWNYLQNGGAQGPVPTETLQALIASGQVGGDDLVWRPGLTEWTKASQFPELNPLPPLTVTPTGSSLPPLTVSPEPIAPLAVAPVPSLVPASPAPLIPPVPMAPIALAPIPPAPVEFQASLPSPALAFDEAMEALRATKPWVRFMGVLGILGIVFLVVLALVFFALSSALESTLSVVPAAARLAIPVVYLVLAALQLPPVIFLHRFANRIAELLASRNPEDLARAMDAQKSFWRYVGILTLVMLCCYAAAAVLAIVGLAASGHKL
jgi:hypothetical protein